MVSKSRDARCAAKSAVTEAAKAVEKKIGGEKNGGKRMVAPKSKYYAADDVKARVASRKGQHKPAKIRASITPGTVLILLAGRHRGKRVICLKKLDSGLLVVTGPFSLNGVPLRKVDPAYVIACNTKIDVSKVDVAKFDEKYLKAEKKAMVAKGEEDFMAVDSGETKKSEIPESKIADQKAVDSVVIAEIKKDAMMSSYLKARFSLTKGQYPHQLLF